MKGFFETVLTEQQSKQKFWAWAHPEQEKYAGFDYYFDSVELIGKMKAEEPAVKFVFHGFFDPSVWPKLAFSNLPRRCVWVCWGHDLYRHKRKNRGIKDKGMHLLHSIVSKRLIQVYALNAGDGEIIQKILWTNDVKVLPYPLTGASSLVPSKHENQPVVIMVGNSAAPTNEHITAFNWLKKFSDQNIKIVAPLNYAGPEDYVRMVIEHGDAVFGDKFEGITRMLDKTEYDQLLASTDIVVFAHERQQGLYVAYSVLKYGKKIFLRENTTSYRSLVAFGFKVEVSESIPQLTFGQLVDNSDIGYKQNPELMEMSFSEDALRPKWQNELMRLCNEHE